MSVRPTPRTVRLSVRTLASRLLGILVAALVLAPATGVAAATAASDPPVSPDRMVVHGEITDSRGQGIHGAWVAVYQLDNGRPRLGGVTRTDTSGAYEMDVQLPAGTVVVRVALRYSGGVYTSPRQLSIEPGHSYSVNARLFPERGFLFGSVPEAPVITTVVAKSGSATVDWV